MVKSLEAISLQPHNNELSENFAGASWDTDSKSAAASLLNGLTNFDFIITFLLSLSFIWNYCQTTRQNN